MRTATTHHVTPAGSVIWALPTVLLAFGLAIPAWADGLTAESLAGIARLHGDAVIADACKLRPQSWLVVSVPAIRVELERLSKSLEPSGGLDPAHVADFTDGALNQAIDEGTVQFARYGQASCKAIQADGSLTRIDALVAGFKKPVR